MADLDAVLNRVQKLLALSASANVHEAALAASRAQALIQAHRLESILADLASGEAGGSAPIEEEALERARRPRAWRGMLAHGLANSNACLTYSMRVGSEEELRLVGRAEDRRVVRTLFQWLAPRLEWLSATHGGQRDRAWHEAFRVGAAEELLERLNAPNEQETPSAGGALVRAEHNDRRAAVEAWASANLRLGSGRSRSLDARGYAQGQAAAHEIDPTRNRASRGPGS